ncbi:MAG: TIGR00282 family metallophosphoesterase [Acidobacteriota bacterium]
MRILFIGDIVGKPGRKAVKELVRKIMDEHKIDFVIANGENAAGGKGITRDVAKELFDAGVDVLTMGNHVWDNKDVYNFIDDEPRLIRPANYPGDCPGRGYNVFPGPNGYRIGIINISGRVFMGDLDSPFTTIDYILKKLEGQTEIIIVDIHAEATSEKIAFSYYIEGKVTAILGTHTHVQTSDEKILPGGTAYITDVGMTGPSDSVLGVTKELSIQKFLTQRPVGFDVASGPSQFDAVVIEIDQGFKPTKIYRIKEHMAE